jgi:hypothetical protein
MAKWYKVVQLPGGQMKPRRPKNDPYNCWLPSDLYREYKKNRGFYLKENIDRLKIYQKKRHDRQEKDDLELNQILRETEGTIQEYHAENII